MTALFRHPTDFLVASHDRAIVVSSGILHAALSQANADIVIPRNPASGEGLQHATSRLPSPVQPPANRQFRGAKPRLPRADRYQFGEFGRLGKPACDYEYWDPTGTPYEPLPVANRIIDMIVENIG